MLNDMTARKQAEAALQFLATASSALGFSLDSDVTLATSARLAIPFLADACSIMILGQDGAGYRVSVAHVDPARAVLLRGATWGAHHN